MKKTTEVKLKKLQQILRSMEKVAIGFSGGVDSSLLLAVAAETLGKKHVVAITVDSAVFPKKELEAAQQFTTERKINHVILLINLTAIKYIAKNPPDRCYYCKKVIFSKIQNVAAKKHIQFVLDASNADDVHEYRPGMNALKELMIRSPLVEARFTKKDIREVSKHWGLNTWEKPSGACLATRFPYGEEISKKKLQIIEHAELFLHALGIIQVRVRSHHTLARIEVTPRDFHRVLRHAQEITDHLKKLGYTYITLDLEGYRSGSLNEVLSL